MKLVGFRWLGALLPWQDLWVRKHCRGVSGRQGPLMTSQGHEKAGWLLCLQPADWEHQLKVPERQELKYLSKGWQRQTAGPWHSSCLVSFLSSIPGNWALDTEIELRCRKIKQMSCLASWVWADTPCTTLSSVLPGKQVVPVSQARSWRKKEDGEQDAGCPSFSGAWFWGVLFLLFWPSRTPALESPSQGAYFSLALNLTPWLDLEPHFLSLPQAETIFLYVRIVVVWTLEDTLPLGPCLWLFAPWYL